jgi:hypothetical protein
MVPVVPVVTGITFVFTFHIHRVSIARCLYYKIFAAGLLTTFPSPEIAMCVNSHVLLFFVITCYDVRFIVIDGSVSIHLFIL